MIIVLKKLENTYTYGIVNDNSISYDDQKILGDYLLNYKLKKIRCWTDISSGILGIEIYHKNRITSEEKKTINVEIKKGGKGDSIGEIIEQELILNSNEYINEITLWKNEAPLGFEVKTNKNREKVFGLCGEGDKIELNDEFDNGNKCLVGFFLDFSKKDFFINNIGFYFIDKKAFYLNLYLGYFILRNKAKKDDFKNIIKEKLKQLDISNLTLYRACCLPDNQFYEIFKYIYY